MRRNFVYPHNKIANISLVVDVGVVSLPPTTVPLNCIVMVQKKAVKYSVAQDRFVKKTRQQIDTDGSSFFDDHDWRNIIPSGGSRSSLRKAVTVESFYVKPIAAWVPDKLFENHVPSCPRCRSPRYVDCSAARWINFPKVLFGVSSHQYLDTKLYPCRGCGKRFTGYNRESMDLDEEKYMGFFNIYLSARFAVNEELISFITNMYDKSTSTIHRILTGMATDKYLNDHIYYLHACRAKRVKQRPKNVRKEDQSQTTLDPLLVGVSEAPEASPAERTLLRLQCDLKRTRLNLRSAEMTAAGVIDFARLRKVKNGRNRRSQILASVGVGKLDQFMGAGIHSGRDLVEYTGIHPVWSQTPRRREAFRDLREQCQHIFNARNEVVSRLEQEVSLLQIEIDKKQEEVDLQNNLGLIDLVGRDDDRQAELIRNLEKGNPIFSKMTDPVGYNARIISAGRIDQILLTDFLERKPVQQAKMVGKMSEIVKIDFEYKLPDNVYVYEGVGKCFRPYKSLCTVHNQDNQTVYWKVCAGGEAMDEITPGLIALRERQKDHQEVKLVYVDNTDSVGDKLKAIFPTAEIREDPFHWMKRWDKVLADKNGESGAIFRGLMSRALYNCTDTEYRDAEAVVKSKLIEAKKLRQDERPTRKQVMKEVRSVIPQPQELHNSVKAVLQYCEVEDMALAFKRRTRGDDNTALPSPFFKLNNSSLVDAVRKTQLKCITEGYLSDPVGVTLHRKNPATGKIYCCRGTNSNETDNLYLRLLTGNHIGVARADRLISTYLEMSNDRKRMNRLGEMTDLFTHKTETLALINSMARSAGFKDEELPYRSLSTPPTAEDIEAADIGFDIAVVLPTGKTVGDTIDTGVPSAASDDNIEDDRVLQEEDQAAGNVRSTAGNTVNSVVDVDDDSNDPVVEGSPLDEELNLATETNAALDTVAIDIRVKALLPEVRKRETTMQAFSRLTRMQPWIPFYHGTGPLTASQQEEVILWEAMSQDYKRKLPPRHSSGKGYHSFMIAWNLEAGRRYKVLTVEGDDEVVLINKKSVIQLQEHYDFIQQRLGSAARIETAGEQAEHDSNVQRLNHCLRQTRATIQNQGPVVLAQPIVYPQAGIFPTGNPLTFNADVVRNSLQPAPATARNPAPFVLQPFVVSTLAQHQTKCPLDGFRDRKYCTTCGWQRAHHERDESFGSTCTKELCGKCNRLKKFHNKDHFTGKLQMGPFCRSTPHPDLFERHGWYTAPTRKRKKTVRITALVIII